MTQSQQYTFDSELRIQEKARLKSLEEEKLCLETKFHRIESELASCELAKENLKRDKVIVSTSGKLEANLHAISNLREN